MLVWYGTFAAIIIRIQTCMTVDPRVNTSRFWKEERETVYTRDDDLLINQTDRHNPTTGLLGMTRALAVLRAFPSDCHRLICESLFNLLTLNDYTRLSRNSAMEPPNVVLFDNEPIPYLLDGKPGAESRLECRRANTSRRHSIMVVMCPAPEVLATICVCLLQRLILSLRCDESGLNQVGGRRLSV